MMDLLKALIIVSEKAANIARTCRQNEHLFSLLIQKKKSDEANPRFVEDFKTLADVLIQEMVKHDIRNQELSDILGEENNTFENKLGEKICVEIKNTEEETSDLLENVLNGDHIAATLLAAEVHREIQIKQNEINLTNDFHISLEKLGIWIDPIDCTAEYINGDEGDLIENIYRNGLKCVTILIGVFDKETGRPVMGVINRPFPEESNFGQNENVPYIWGISLPNICINSGITCSREKHIVCVSSSETPEIKQKLEENGFKLIEASGAGYKILTVILGLADAYVLTKGTTFKWDTCAPHAILDSLGGGIVDFHESLRTNTESIKYFIGGNNCNTTGIIAFKRPEVLKYIINAVKDVY